MACEAVHSGERFLAATLTQLDCQARTIGSYGYSALADPASPVSLALASLLTVFVALFGIRVLFGRDLEGRDILVDVLRVGIVLTLATSWPAWRVIGYDVVIEGPGEIFRSIGLSSGLPGSSGDLVSRLQRVDDGLAVLNTLGTGRLGVASGDWFQLGLARSAFLTGTIVPQALVRIAAGLLLALAPLMAATLLFSVTRGVFAGWARALTMIFLASIAVSLVEAVQLAVVEPWLQDALARRSSQADAFDAAIEAQSLMLGFGLVALGLVALMARVAFSVVTASSPLSSVKPIMERSRNTEGQLYPNHSIALDSPSRARSVAFAVSESMAREVRPGSSAGAATAMSIPSDGGRVSSSDSLRTGQQLGSSYRRTQRRHSATSQRRDQAN